MGGGGRSLWLEFGQLEQKQKNVVNILSHYLSSFSLPCGLDLSSLYPRHRIS